MIKSSGSSKKPKERNNFWDTGGYMPTVRRLHFGVKSVEDLRLYFQERAQLVLNHAKELSELSSKWKAKVNKSEEYGVIKQAWETVLMEPAQVSGSLVHLGASLNSKCSEIKNWTQNNNKLLFKNKNVKDHESRFKLAQKEWTDRVSRMQKTKSDYNVVTRKLHNHDLKKNICVLEQGGIQDNDKIREKTDRLRKEQEYSKLAYEETLRLVNDRKDCYSQEMIRLFESCQQIEKERVEFVKSVSYDMLELIKVCNTEVYSIYDKLEGALMLFDANKSLEHWFEHKGPRKELEGFVFEDATVQENVNALARMSTKHSSDAMSDSYLRLAKMSLNNDKNHDDEIVKMDSGTCSPEIGRHISVVALYDYNAGEEDELSFRAGQKLFRFSEEDENGWVKCMDEGGQYGYVPFKFIRDQPSS